MPAGTRKRAVRLRVFSRGLALAVAALFSLWWQPWQPPLASLSPFVGVCAAVAARSAGFVTLLSLPVLLLVIRKPRWFCSYLCQVGFLQELCGAGVARCRGKASASGKRPPVWRAWPKLERVLAVSTFGGALLGYPLFLWLDPLALFGGFFSACVQGFSAATVVAALLFPLVMLFDLLLPHVWCRRICPLGGAQDMLSSLRLRRSENVTLQSGDQNSLQNTIVLRRRGFLSVFAGLAGACAIQKTGRVQKPLRPPGALSEDRFSGVCVRCGNCMRVCPSRILRPDLGLGGPAGLLAPVADFDDGYCKEDCNRCGLSCPSGAIRRLPLVEKRAQVMGKVKIDLDTCLLAQGRDCTACIGACPYEALSVFSDGFDARPELRAARCTGCGACEAACPVRPVRAARVSSAPRT